MDKLKFPRLGTVYVPKATADSVGISSKEYDCVVHSVLGKTTTGIVALCELRAPAYDYHGQLILVSVHYIKLK